MYTVMIVDDEPLARDVLKAIIYENFNNVSVVCEAINGRQAVEFSSKYEPDIILMDIRIPGINGLEASEQILKQHPNTVILVITAYDDFNYIQQALDLGIKGYCLKPIKDEDVVNKINSCIKFISINLSNAKISKKIEKTESVVRPLIQKEIVSAFISSNSDKTEIESYIGFLQENIEAGYFMLLSYEQNDSNFINGNIRNKILKEKIYQIMAKFLPLTRKCFFGENNGDTYVVFFIVEKEHNQEKILSEAITIAADIMRKIKVMTNIEISVGIGKTYCGYENFRHSYNEAYYALRKGAGKNEITHFKNIENEVLPSQFQYPLALENELLEYIRLGNFEKVGKLSESMLNEIFDGSNDIAVVKEYMNQFILIIKRHLMLKRPDVKILDSIQTVSELNRMNTLDELRSYCRTSLQYLIDSMVEHKLKGNDSVIVSKVKEYIDRFFTGDINLEKIAEEVGLGPAYISRIFKEELGMNYIDYIIQKRINHAKELMLSGEKNIRKVSEAVGYSDVNYFCRVFKRHTGLTTGQFKLHNSRMISELRDK